MTEKMNELKSRISSQIRDITDLQKLNELKTEYRIIKNDEGFIS